MSDANPHAPTPTSDSTNSEPSTVTYGDGKKPQYVVDAHPDDPEARS